MEIAFKFHYLRQNVAIGIIPTKGLASERELLLGEERLSYETILSVTARGDRLFLALNSSAKLGPKISQTVGKSGFLRLKLFGKKAIALQRFLNAIASKQQCDRLRRDAILNGKAHLFHAVTCPECGASIGLHDRGAMAIYCPYCESLFKENLQRIALGPQYARCSRCEMFDRVADYTEFYLAIGPVVHFYHQRHLHICDRCADTLFWRMLRKNLLYTLLLTGFAGLALAILIKIRLCVGRDPQLKNLPRANKLLNRQKYAEAESIYQQCYYFYPEHPGLLLNEGIAAWRNRDEQRAQEYCDRARRACPNYAPAWHWLRQLEDDRALVSGVLGEDLDRDLRLSLREATLGAEKDISVSHWELCDRCFGRALYCPTCKGSKRVWRQKEAQTANPPRSAGGCALAPAKARECGRRWGRSGRFVRSLEGGNRSRLATQGR